MMRFRLRDFPVLLVFITFPLISKAAVDNVCTNINHAFTDAESNEEDRTACQCFFDTSATLRREPRSAVSIRDLDDVWIGCTRQKMPAVHRAINALNETMVSKLWIWDSVIPIVPNDMFAHIRPRTLSIERSSLSMFREGAFASIGQRLRTLHLKENIIKTLSTDMFKDLGRLQVLDLSTNKLETISVGQLDNLGDLTSLSLNDNALSTLDDGAFKALTNLKHLNLANNKLSNITRETFRGLKNLEHLNLQSNSLTQIDWSAFSHMKHLKSLDLGTNQITGVQLRGLDTLERLYINNNSIDSLKNVTLRDLPNLAVLSLDRNKITRINDGDMKQLAQSSKLISLSLAFNNIELIEARALDPLHKLSVLSLQSNKLGSLVSPGSPSSVLRPLLKLKELFLSANDLKEVDEHDFTGMQNLLVLALDNNQINTVHMKAFSGLNNLQRLFINGNHLKDLPTGVFDGLRALEAIDLSNNKWQCVCGEQQWLHEWLQEIGDRSISAPNQLGCLDKKECTNNIPVDKDPSSHSVWITVIAAILAVVSIAIMVAIACLYMEDGKHMRHAANGVLTSPLKRVPSDLMNLIPASTVSSQLTGCQGVNPGGVLIRNPPQSPPSDGKKKTVRFQSA